MTGPARGIRPGLWRSVDLNGMPEQECVCLGCGAVMLSQRRVGDRHRRDDHDSIDVDRPLFAPLTNRPGGMVL